MPHPVSIRPARPGEAEALSAFAARLFHQTYSPTCRAEDVRAHLAAAFTPERQAAELEDPEAATLLAEVEGRPAAYAQLRRGPAEGVPGARPVEVARFYVDATWHGRGVADALMDAALRGAAALGGDAVWLSVWEKNERAIRFYRRRGFERVGSATFTMGADVQCDHRMARAAPE